MIYLVEVQHASDHDLDGKWYELERCASEDAAYRSLRWLSGPYHGRPLRVRPVEGQIAPMPTVNRPPRGWARSVARARRFITR